MLLRKLQLQYANVANGPFIYGTIDIFYRFKIKIEDMKCTDSQIYSTNYKVLAATGSASNI